MTVKGMWVQGELRMWRSVCGGGEQVGVVSRVVRGSGVCSLRQSTTRDIAAVPSACVGSEARWKHRGLGRIADNC